MLDLQGGFVVSRLSFRLFCWFLFLKNVRRCPFIISGVRVGFEKSEVRTRVRAAGKEDAWQRE